MRAQAFAECRLCDWHYNSSAHKILFTSAANTARWRSAPSILDKRKLRLGEAKCTQVLPARKVVELVWNLDLLSSFPFHTPKYWG